MDLQIAVLFLQHEGRAVPWQQKSLPVGCLFLEIMKVEEKEGARSSSCIFLLLVIIWGIFFLFLFVLMSHLHGVLISMWNRNGQAAHGVDVPLGSSGQAQGEDEAAPAAGPPGALGTTGCSWQPGKLKLPREGCSSRLTSRSCRTITQKGSKTWWM